MQVVQGRERHAVAGHQESVVLGVGIGGRGRPGEGLGLQEPVDIIAGDGGAFGAGDEADDADDARSAVALVLLAGAYTSSTVVALWAANAAVFSGSWYTPRSTAVTYSTSSCVRALPTITNLCARSSIRSFTTLPMPVPSWAATALYRLTVSLNSAIISDHGLSFTALRFTILRASRRSGRPR